MLRRARYTLGKGDIARLALLSFPCLYQLPFNNRSPIDQYITVWLVARGIYWLHVCWEDFRCGTYHLTEEQVGLIKNGMFIINVNISPQFPYTNFSSRKIKYRGLGIGIARLCGILYHCASRLVNSIARAFDLQIKAEKAPQANF